MTAFKKRDLLRKQGGTVTGTLFGGRGGGNRGEIQKGCFDDLSTKNR